MCTFKEPDLVVPPAHHHRHMIPLLNASPASSISRAVAGGGAKGKAVDGERAYVAHGEEFCSVCQNVRIVEEHDVAGVQSHGDRRGRDAPVMQQR